MGIAELFTSAPLKEDPDSNKSFNKNEIKFFTCYNLNYLLASVTILALVPGATQQTQQEQCSMVSLF